MTVTNQNLVEKEIKSRLNSDNSCYHSVQNILSSWLLTNLWNYNFVCGLYGYKTWSLALKEEQIENV
jgi:hypothetical protein